MHLQFQKCVLIGGMALSCLAANAANSAAVNTAANVIAVHITTPKTILQSNEDVVAVVTITNTSATDQRILKYATPFAGIQGPLFDITRDGVKVQYLGAIMKRAAPTTNDYFLLKPGKPYIQQVKLSQLYDLSITGDYKIAYRIAAPDLSGTDGDKKRLAAPRRAAVQSEVVSLFIHGRQPRAGQARTPTAQASRLTGRLAEDDCTEGQSGIIQTAFTNAQALADQSLAYFAAGNADLRYVTWFGNYDTSRFAIGKAHFAAIQDAMRNKPVTVSCTCNPVSTPDQPPVSINNLYAYVYPSQPYRIYTCPAFWTTTAKGTNSQSGIMIHEMSHFIDVAATVDFTYGTRLTQLLALTYPTLALFNAETHEYFAENSPASTSALFAGDRDEYVIEKVAGGFTVTDTVGLEGIQYFSSIYRVQFANVAVAFDLDANAGKAFRIYRAAFDRTPDAAGLGYWIKALDGGVPIDAVAASFIASKEFQILYGPNLTNAAFLTKVYANILHRAPDQGGYDFWLGILNRGVAKSAILATISESAENKAQVLAAISSGIAYTPYGASLSPKKAALQSPFGRVKK